MSSSARILLRRVRNLAGLRYGSVDFSGDGKKKDRSGVATMVLAAGAGTAALALLIRRHSRSRGNQNALNTEEKESFAPVAANAATVTDSDPFGNEPERDPSLRPVSVRPFCGEPPLSLLVEDLYTPGALFYVRNHFPVPDLDEENYELGVSGLGVQDTKFRMDDLKRRFPKVTVTAALQSSGNGRAGPWNSGAVGCARWSGARLRDVLLAAGLCERHLESGVWHVHLEGHDAFAATVPLEKALSLSGDVLLAYEMNGEALSRDHGFPVRVVVPGFAGYKSVKWVRALRVTDKEMGEESAVRNTPVNSAICGVTQGSNGKVSVVGYAVSGAGCRILRVEVTVDGGETWKEAHLRQEETIEPRHYGWTLWRAEMEVLTGENELEVWSRAVDSSHNVQPERGNMTEFFPNAYCRRKYRATGSES